VRGCPHGIGSFFIFSLLQETSDYAPMRDEIGKFKQLTATGFRCPANSLNFNSNLASHFKPPESDAL
jgi:hypothetical protein